MIEVESHNCQMAEVERLSTRPPSGLVARSVAEVQRALSIVREVLRGFCAGPPPDDSRPRGGCC